MFEKESEEYRKRFDNSDIFPRDIEESYQKGAECGYKKASEWHYVTDELPPNPKESEDGISIIPLNYICAYSLNNEYDDYEIGDFMYLGNGVWNGENKNYPIYAWLDCAVEVPLPRKENE